MHRGTPREALSRAFKMISRATLKSANDKTLMQEIDVDLFHEEGKTKVERFQSYGFSAVPHPATKSSGQAQGQSGSDSQQETAEALIFFLGGNRAHGIALAVDDRRHRPNNLKEGESVQYDDQGQQVYITRDRIVIHSDKEVHVQRGDAHGLFTNGKTKLSYGDISVTMKDSKVFLGKEGVQHAVLTDGGPSQRVFASITELDGPISAADTAKRTKASGGAGGQGGGTGQ